MRAGVALLALVGALAVAGVASAAPGAKVPPTLVRASLGGPQDRELDWPAIHARTERIRMAQAQQRLDGSERIMAPRAGALARRAVSLVGAELTGLDRLSFPSAPAGDEARQLREAGSSLDEALRELTAAATSTRQQLAGLEARLEREQIAEGVRQRARARASEAGRALGDLQRLAAGARAALEARTGGWWERLTYYRWQLAGDGLPQRLALLARALDATAPVESVLGAELSYVEGGGPAAPFPTTTVVPAYAAASSATALEDTTQGREIEDDPELRAKAAALRTTKAAYDFVKQQARLDWYAGNLKGTTETLRDLRGNDVDLTGLLIALLRAQGTPARYVQGTIEVPAWRMADLLGLLTSAEAAEAQAAPGGGLPAEVETRLFQALAAAGITVQPVVSGGRIASVRWLHTWAEAFVPYADYRGAGREQGGRQWIPLDPVIQGGPRLAASPPTEDVFAATGLTADELQDLYLSAADETSPKQAFRAAIEARLAARRPGLTYEQLLRRTTPVPEALPFLPGTLPFTVVSAHAEHAFVPEADKHRVRVQVADAAGTVLDVTVPLHELAGRRTLLTFEPASDDDRYAIDAAGGLYQVAAAAVAVLPVLRVAGASRGQATRAVGLGSRLRWRFELLLPGGGSRPIENDLVAGNVVAVGIGSPVNRFDAARDVTETFDSPAGRILYGIAAAYANGWTEGEDELARLLQVAPIRPTANVVFVSNKLEVDEALGVVRRLLWKGIQVDADHRALQPVELLPGRGRDLLQLAGLEGSYQEALVLRAATGEEAVSAVTVIREARRQGVEVLRLRGAAPELSRLLTTPQVQREVVDQLARGREVLIPASDLALRDWSGTGFVARDIATGEGGYFLSGIISGGMTIVSPAAWADQTLLDQLNSPTRPEAEKDVTKAARIVRVSGDFQRVTVGTTAPQALRVVVTTLEGRPVEGVPVTFRAVGGAKVTLSQSRMSGLDLPLLVKTDRNGYAQGYATADPVVLNAAIVEPGGLDPSRPYDALVGANEVMAQFRVGQLDVALPQPFVLTGVPDVPARLELPCSLQEGPNGLCQRRYPIGVQLGESLWARLVDQHGNRLANRAVTWSTANGEGLFVDFSQGDGTSVRVLDIPDTALAGMLTIVTATDGLVTTDFVPAVGGSVTLHAGCGAVLSDFRILVFEPQALADRFVLRPKSTQARRWAGIQDTMFPAPVGMQVLAWADGRWSPVTGEEPDVPAIQIHMQTTDVTKMLAGSGPPVSIRTESLRPTDTLTALLGDPRDDATTAMFWPKYEVNGTQMHVWSATLYPKDGAPYFQAANTYQMQVSSRPVTVERFRLRPGSAEQATGPFGSASLADLAVIFKIDNPASQALYATVVQEPRVDREVLVGLPDPETFPHHPLHPAKFKLLPELRSSFILPVRPDTHGGTVRIELEAEDPTRPGSLTRVGARYLSIDILPVGLDLLSGEPSLSATIHLAVRNFESTVTPVAGQTSPPDPTEDPILIAGQLNLHVFGDGDLTVSVGTVGATTPLAGAKVKADQFGNVTALGPLGALPLPLQSGAGTLRFDVAPDLTATTVRARFVPADGSDAIEQTWPFSTQVTDSGVFPIGHTFVKDVSVVDGHLARQFTDLAIQGRGAGLSFSRTYTNRGGEEGPLGRGWTHAWRSWVIRNRQNGRDRFLVVGGEGTGQMFECTARPCRNQRGFHGTLEPSEAEVVYTAPNGVKHRYGRSEVQYDKSVRYWLTAIEDPRGNVSTLDYGLSREVLRVWEPGNRRALQFAYAAQPGGEVSQLVSVELMASSQGVQDAEALRPIDAQGLCLAFRYGLTGLLAEVSRRPTGCASAEPAFRTESYEYAAADRPTLSSEPSLDDNLVRYTDPDGRVVEYEWHARGEPIEGAGQYLLMGDSTERVKVVREVAQGSPALETRFKFNLRPQQGAVAGEVLPLFETVVTGPRPGVPPTIYRLDPYGAAARVERPVEPGVVAVKQTTWDPRHVRPVREVDPLGRETTFAYDARGNLIERRTGTSRPPDAPASVEPFTVDGVPVTAVAERWAYDPTFNGETCHLDAEGRVTTTTYHTFGLPKVRAEFATPLPAAVVAQTGSCEEAAALAVPADRDHLTELAYCQTETCIQPAEARRGDLASTVDHGRAANQGLRKVAILAYDGLGYPRLTAADPDVVNLVTTLSYDPRGLLRSQTDTLGHRTTTSYDDLDRPWIIERLNRASESPGQRRVLAHYADGQLRSERIESIGTGGAQLTRTIARDAYGRPAVTTEQDLVSGRSFATTVEYDEAGNRWQVTDRRGVRTRTVFDYGDRPTETWVSVPGPATFAADGGDATGFEVERRVGRAGFDAAGNKVWEEDVHGHRTDYSVDTLYRVVRVTQPATPDEGGAMVRHQVERAYDRVGNKLLERDGNGHATRFAYDQANREVLAIDPLDRAVTRQYDGLGALRLERTLVGGTERRARVMTYDGLGRPLDVAETWATPTGSRTRTASTRYDDTGHRVLARDPRGVVTVRVLDDLDRVTSEVADTTDQKLGRTYSGAPLMVGAETRFEYDALGHRRVTIDALGHRLEDDVDAFGRIVTRRLPMGVTEATIYDGEGLVVERQDARGIRFRTYRDPLGRVTEESVVELDPTQVPARPHRLAGELPIKRRQYVDGEALLVHEWDARGNRTTRTLDGLHREVRSVDAAGGTVETQYDAVNRRRVIDPRSYEAWIEYDAVNRPVRLEDRAPGGSLIYAQEIAYRDAVGEEEHRSRAGRGTLKVSDGMGWVVRVERSGTGDDELPLTANDLTEYDDGGVVVAQTDANLHTTRYVVDGLRRVTEETVAFGTPAEMRTRNTYDRVGNRLEVKGPRGSWAFDLKQEYDDLGRPVRSVDAGGQVTSRAFDGAGNRRCERRPTGGDPVGAGGAAGKTVAQLEALVCGGDAATAFDYDELGKLTGVTTALGATSYLYDEVRNLISKQDANGHLTIFGYDGANRRTDEWQRLDAQARLTRRSEAQGLQRSSTPDAGFTTGALHWQAEHDAAGNVTQVTEPKGDVRGSTYGALNRVETTTFSTHDKPLGLPIPVSTATSYDGDGRTRVVTQTKATWRTYMQVEATVAEETRSEHDGLGRLWRQHRYDGKVVEYAYDLKGNRKKVTDPDGVETSYGYDEADRLTTATTPRGTATYGYWPDGLRKAVALPNGLTEARCYDPVGQLTAIVTRSGTVADACPDSAQDLGRFRYAYDANGNRSTQQEWRADPATQALGPVELTTYGYDALDRLVGVQYSGGKAELYRLDPVGNRTGERELSGVSLSGQELLSFEPPAGAAVVRDVTGTFNRADWLTSLADAKDPSRDVALGWTASGELLTKTTASVSRRLSWDGRGAMVAVTDNGVEVGRYDYDAEGLRVKRRTAAEQVEYVLDEAHVLQEASGAVPEHPAYRRYHYGDGPLLVVDGAMGRFIGTDALGSPTDLTSTTGQVEKKRQYDAWGRYRNGTAPAPGEAKLGFTGHQFDPETGLIYARARYYDPEIGRFISRDAYEGETEEAPSLHRFAYAHGNPLVYRDADGRSATVVGAALGLAWGVGQAVGGVFTGNVQDAGDFFGVIAQNTLGGIEIGASIDISVTSGGLLANSVGAGLGMAGLDALTLGGKPQDGRTFFTGQVVEGGKGAAIGLGIGIAARGLSALAQAAAKTPPGQWVVRQASEAVGVAVGTRAGQALVGAAEAFSGAAKKVAGWFAREGAAADAAAAEVGLGRVVQAPRAVAEALGRAEEAVAEAFAPRVAAESGRLMSSGASGIPKTGVERFDRLATGTEQYSGWAKNVEARGYTVNPRGLPAGTHAEIQNGVLTVDPNQFRYIDLLHESRHIVQLERAAAQGVPGLNMQSAALFERGAYEYELRLAQRYGFSAEYRSFALGRIADYWNRTIQQKAARSRSFQELSRKLWR
jgi:RHS repeat-associated protein